MGRVGKVRHSLESMARNGMWPTASARDSNTVAKVRRGQKSLEKGMEIVQPLAVQAGGSSIPETRGLALNPNWVCWLMGWPIGWESLMPLPETSYREWLWGFSIASSV